MTSSAAWMESPAPRSPGARISRMEAGDTLLPSIAMRRGRSGEPKLQLPEGAATSAPRQALQPMPSPTGTAGLGGEEFVTPVGEQSPVSHRGSRTALPTARRPLDLSAADKCADGRAPGGSDGSVLLTAPPEHLRPAHRGFPELHSGSNAARAFFQELSDALVRLRPTEVMATRRLALHKVGRLLGEVPDGADSGALGAVMAAAGALDLLVAVLQDSCIADCETDDVWLLHCALALCVNLACHDPDAIVREAGLGPFLLSGLRVQNERTRMLCAAGARNIASSLDGAMLIADPATRAALEDLARDENMATATYARGALVDAARLQGGGRAGLAAAQMAACLLGAALVLIVLVVVLAATREPGSGLSRLRAPAARAVSRSWAHAASALSQSVAGGGLPPRACE